MKTLLLVATALAFGAAAHAAPQISIGGSTSGSATFTGTGTGNLNVSLGAISGTATDSVSPGAGTYTMTAFGPKLATSVGSGVWDFAVGVTDTFTYTNGANSVTETLTYQSVNDGSANPHFAGTDSVTAISGSAAFVSTFGGVGRGSIFDYAVDALPTGVTLDNVALGTTSITSGISSGQLNPNPPAIPEPSTLAIFGLGVMGLFAGRRMINRRKATS